MVTRAWLTHHQQTAKKFLTAIVRAHRFMYASKDATVRIVSQAIGFSQQVISQAYDMLLGREGVFPVNQGLGYDSIASKARPLDASPRPTEARFPAQTKSFPSYQRVAW